MNSLFDSILLLYDTQNYYRIFQYLHNQNFTDFQVFNFTDFSQIVNQLSISSSCNKSVKIRLVATCHLQTCYNLLKQLAASLWITRFDNQLATSLLTICKRLAVNKLSKAIQTHPDITLLKTSQSWVSLLLVSPQSSKIVQFTHVKISQLVASLQTSRQQAVFALLVTGCQQVWNKLLTTCSKLVDIVRLVIQGCSNRAVTIMIQQYCYNLVSSTL